MTPLQRAKEHCANYQPAMNYEPLPIQITQNGGASRIKRAAGGSRHSAPISAQKTRARADARTKKSHHRPLLKEFRHDGLSYRQIAVEKEGAIYEQNWTWCRSPSVAYEVVRVRRRDGFQIDGRFVEPAEVYPRSEQWGEQGWTFCDEDAAFEKLREITATAGGGG
jgi:hypothetical protein